MHRATLEAMARKHTRQALAALVAALENPRERVPAAVALLDRGWGKPKQQVEAVGDEATMLHLIAAKLISAELIDDPSRARAHAREAVTIDAVVDLSAPPPEE